MADVHDMLNTDREADQALARAYSATTDQNVDVGEAIGYGLIAIGRCILALGTRLDYILSDRRDS